MTHQRRYTIGYTEHAIINCDTGETYANAYSAATALGLSPTHVRRVCRSSGARSRYHLSYGREREIFGSRRIKIRVHSLAESSLCCRCRTMTCSWVRAYRPVEGWDADPNPVLDSYHVKSCPEFRKENLPPCRI